MSRTFLYARVSTVDQDTANQAQLSSRVRDLAMFNQAITVSFGHVI
jgi:DNA invertase Pin-like site-specific DNA recombinase